MPKKGENISLTSYDDLLRRTKAAQKVSWSACRISLFVN